MSEKCYCENLPCGCCEAPAPESFTVTISDVLTGEVLDCCAYGLGHFIDPLLVLPGIGDLPKGI